MENKDIPVNEEQKNNMREYKEAVNIVNKKIEEVYENMKGVKIVETEEIIGVKNF